MNLFSARKRSTSGNVAIESGSDDSKFPETYICCRRFALDISDGRDVNWLNDAHRTARFSHLHPERSNASMSKQDSNHTLQE